MHEAATVAMAIGCVVHLLCVFERHILQALVKSQVTFLVHCVRRSLIDVGPKGTSGVVKESIVMRRVVMVLAK